ncbi:type VI secretion protein [Neisseria meningitidis]|uniref:virB8 family protein n=1 Tax=Neisseria meningitidis TaxID=487 RepID=UPI000F50CEC0|nr:type IV secretion system protein [Neisseria meningitidis]MBG8681375.1 type IV secretion system protein [Neisseria meningitidis]MBG8742507.1 type IV secretion system protein [Neisseria meningitidis]MBG8826374.1 type IV secretion system protein [Neisseria meningitidis]MBJ7807956.1 type IV secretion system protein [Neisseria meningitidis]MBJ7838174.1 type IV secretion system protein [Neisseria meningitidis]
MKTNSNKTPKAPNPQQQGLKFIQEAKEFHKSEIDRVRKNSRIAWRISGVCLVITGLAVGAVAGLTPLKTTQPFLVRVDNNTGVTDVVTTLKTAEKTYGEVVDKYWLAQYVRYRESYDWQTIQAIYDAAMLLSDPTIQAEFAKFYNNPTAAPHKILRDQYKVIVKVNAISFLGNDVAQIRFEKQTIPTNSVNQPLPPQRFIATVSYAYKNEPQEEKDRLINPLGFQMTSYRVDPENTPNQ